MSRFGGRYRENLRTLIWPLSTILQTPIYKPNRKAVYGYICGGQTSVNTVATTDRLTFSTGTTAVRTAANLSLQRRFPAGISDTTTYGYMCGGFTGGATVVATTDRLTFSTGTTAVRTAANISAAREGSGSISDGTTYGYVCGGASTAYMNNVDRLTFSTGTTAASVNTMPQAQGYTTGISDNNTNGYICGGITISAITNITNVLNFSTSILKTLSSAYLSSNRYGASSLSDNVSYGYICGGNTGAVVATTDRLTFSTGTRATITAANISTARFYSAGTSDGTTYGYICGGNTGGRVATTDRIIFSTGTTATQTAGNISETRDSMGSLSDYAV